MNWLKEAVGISEPIYGPSAIQSVAQQASDTPWTETTKQDLQWFWLNYTCVESKTFYTFTDDGHVVMTQIIHNCLAQVVDSDRTNSSGVRTTNQFCCKIFFPDKAKSPVWTSDTLENCTLDESKTKFKSTGCRMELSDDADSYAISSSVSKQAIVDLKFTKRAPGIVIGKDGTSYFGTDPAKPWGRMRHSFWPRCKTEGSLITPAGAIDMAGTGLFVHVLMGIRPNLAAATWNFLTIHTPTYSAFSMEYTTPPSYGSTVVTVGAVATDGKIVTANAQPPVTHTASAHDAEIGWSPPEAAEFQWAGPGVAAAVAGSLGGRADRIDVLAEIPAFLKIIIAQAAGTKPFIYQYLPHLPLKVTQDGTETAEDGRGFMEATYITGT